MTIKELVSKLAKLEGKRHQASVGDVRELVGLICDEIYRDQPTSEDPLSVVLMRNGRRRAKRAKK